MEEIGRRLETARLAKGLTLHVVEEETRIRKKYIEALETGRLTDIPGEVYVKGFLRSYGNYLGLDGEALVEEFKASTAPAPQPEEQQTPKAATPPPREPSVRRERPVVRKEPERPAAARSAEERPARRPASPKGRTKGSSAFMLRRAVVTLLVLVPLVGVGWWLFGQLGAAPPPPPVTQKEEPPAPKEPDSTPPPQSQPPAPPKPTVTTAGPKGNTLDYQVSVSPAVLEMQGFREGFPWVRVTVDGKQVFEGKLTGPVRYEGQVVSIYSGFTTGVDFVVNGERFAEPIKGGPNTITATVKP